MSGAVGVQVMMSASNFLVGLLLIRRTSDAEYGYYILMSTAVLLSTTVQGSFIQPPMIIRLTRSDRTARANLIGGLYRDQSRLVPLIAVLTAALAVALLLTGSLNLEIATLLVAGTAAIIMTLYREFFRMVLFAYRRPNDVLRSDSVYCLLLVGGAAAATLTSYAAAAAAFSMSMAALVGRWRLSQTLWRHEPWNPDAPPGMLREIAHQGAWSAFGSGVHWLFSQGYSYLVAALLDVKAVAAVAATRLLIMPVSLLSTGIGTLMLPTVSKWAHDHQASTVLRRLVLFSLALAGAACCYLVVMWWSRDWIFTHILHKSFGDRDLLLFLWCGIAVVTVLRDQMLYFLVTRGRFQQSSTLTLVSAILSLSISYTAMHRIGVIGALIGLLAGESFNVLGIVAFSLREARRSPGSVASAA